MNIDLRPEKRVKVLFTCGANSEIRSVDVYRTVSDLKLKLEAFAGFSASKMRLFYVDQDLRDIQVRQNSYFLDCQNILPTKVKKGCFLYDRVKEKELISLIRKFYHNVCFNFG